MTAPQPLCRRDDIPDGAARGFDPAGTGHDTLFIVRRGADLRAWEDWCPHWRTGPMAWRKDAYLSADGAHIVCSAHGARFDIATGECVLGACLGDRLRPVALTCDGDGQVFLEPHPRHNDKETET
ncbi:Rieske (2Fe-2S) protein [Ramlibacter sp. MAHUQ-53]|uniref:Rieske (2Fe-2S) protein n=1 Tax=unclassified Ramlibacter TaxID=2617605 RepID=UPI00363559F3